MKRKLLVTAFLLGALLLAAYPMFSVAASSGDVGGLIAESDINPRAARTVESYSLESSHPYSNNFDYTWTITEPGATQIRVHFTKIDVENNYDYVYVYDYAGSQLHKLTGLYSSGGWTAWSYGESIKVRLDTDYSVTDWGFAIDQIEYEGGGGGGGSETNVLTDGVTSSSSLAATGDTEMWTIEVEADALSMHSVLTCGSADFDLYGRLGAEPTTSTYDWRGYTSGGEDVTFDNPGAGTWYIMVRSYSGTGSYELTVTITYDTGGGGEGDGIVTKWAVIVGISDYEAISDLSYCDEDATDWYNYLTGTMGYDNVRVLGDTHTSNYPSYYALATEANVKAALNWMASGADADDQVAFITSGHGSGDGSGSSYLCMWDCSSGEDGEDGNLYDTELAPIIGSMVANQIFIFVDHCYSGGLIPEIAALSNSDNVYMTTTCTDNGYGYDDSTHQNGAWTYYFLEYGLINHYASNPNTLMEDCFDYALAAYPHSGGDTPQEFDGNTSVGFKL